MDALSGEGYTALHIAVEMGNSGVVECLLGNGAKFSVASGLKQETALHLASKIEEQKGNRCIKMLLKSGADPNLKLEDGRTALHIAAKRGNEAMVQALLNGGAKVGLEDDLGNTALDVAMKLENQDCIKLLARSLFSNEKWPKRARNTLAQGIDSFLYSGL